MSAPPSSLTVYVLWHPDARDAPDHAKALFTLLNWNTKRPFAREIGIPTFFRSDPALPENPRPADIDLDAAAHSLVVVLSESQLVRDDDWTRMLSDLGERVRASDRRHELLIAPIDANGGNLSEDLLRTLYAVTANDDPARKQQDLREHVAALITRMVEGRAAGGGAGVKLFISHTKRDARSLALAESIRDALAQPNRPTAFFFDTTHIKATDDIKDSVEEAVGDSTLLAVRTDAYSGSPWCNLEVLAAKRLDRPIVVLDALAERDDRQLPSLGNVPCIRFTAAEAADPAATEAAIRAVVEATVVETMRFHYVHRRLEHLKALGRLPKGARLRARPPEERDLRRRSGARRSSVVYPDPPLPLCELEELGCPPLKLVTPLTAMPVDLAGRVIGLSAANPEEDLRPLGLSVHHLDAAMDLLARALLSKQATIAFGGDLRVGGFTEFLAGLVKAHNAKACGAYEPIRNYLPWPKHLDLACDDEAARAQYLKVTRVAAPKEAVDRTVMPDHATAEGGWLRARGMTAMREKMTKKIDVRIALRGKVSNFSGIYPGIVEEVLLCLRAGKPVFILGGFGGASHQLASVLRGRGSSWPALENGGAFARTHAARVAYHNERAPGAGLERADLKAALDEIAGYGIKGLNNGLKKAENKRLFVTQDIEEAAWLILSGLSHLWSGEGGKGRRR